jgi:prevent-host-death family protein
MGSTPPKAGSELGSIEQVNVHQAKTQLSRLLQDVEAGREVVIARAGVPIARLVPWQSLSEGVAPPGAMAGAITLGVDFDRPLEELFDGLAG